ncbi:DUF58 domain-containing protein [Sandaracinus amylolyticus]|uniref:DUF58 domain-containing protein n=1 Tax=Sandaracinus amylolyticus TaxID=927083 RepID=UPI001F386A6E|nr:DUF58 domain-containing protein [Sandaracinus amylolyticus]UJR86506.1 Hypothetical protein I5071_86010 [Sandaracinus amylolyticus]
MARERAAAAEKKARRARRGLRFTREGRVFVLTTLGVGAGAVNTGNNLLYLVLGLMLSLIVLSGVLSDLVLWWVRVRRALPSRAFVGTPCVVELALANDKKWLPSFSIEVEDQAEDEPTDRRCYFLKVGARAEQVAAYRRVPSKRGVLVLSRFRLSTRYPFGLFEKWRLVDDRAELLVYPALVPVVAPTLPAGARAEDRASPRRGPGTEPANLREYRAGDEARSVHARRSAALGRLVVRERERESGARLSIVLDNARPAGLDDGAWSGAFELAVSRAASLAERALAHGSSVDVLTRSGGSPVVLGGGAPDPILRYLALLAPAQGDAPLPSPRTPSVIVAPELAVEAVA